MRSVLLSSLALVGCASPPALERYWHDHVERALNGAVVGYAFAVYRDGQPIAAGGRGWARVPTATEPGIPMTTATRMQIASVSKPITAVALLRELDARDISIGATMWSLLGDEFGSPGRGVQSITVRHLLTHRSGYSFGYIHSPRIDNTRDLLRRPVPGVPGTRRVYSNINTSLCRTILETITGENYEDYVRAMLEPVGAATMRLWSDPEAVAHAYFSGPEPLVGAPIADDFRDDGAAYGWYGSVDELIRFVGAVRRNRWLDAAATRQMLEAELGWGRRQTLGGPAFAHDGQWLTEGRRGVRTSIALLPDGVDAVLFLNTNGPFSPSAILTAGFDGCVARFRSVRQRDRTVVHIERPPAAAEVRWTLDGSEPTADSPRYTGCLHLSPPARVRCRGFAGGRPVTFTNELVLEAPESVRMGVDATPAGRHTPIAMTSRAHHHHHHAPPGVR